MTPVDTDTLVGSPLSLDQLRLWRLLADCPAQSFRSYGLIEVDTVLSPGRLRRAFEAIAHGHELLRSQPAVVTGLVYPILEERSECAVEFLDMGTFSGDAEDDLMVRELASCSFLEDSAPLRVCFARLARGGSLWGAALPAFLGDGSSIDAILLKVSQIALQVNEPTACQAHTGMSYRSCWKWREQLLAAPEALAGKRFWEGRLHPPEESTWDTIMLDERHHTSNVGDGIQTITARAPPCDLRAAQSRSLAVWYWLVWKLCNCPESAFHIGSHFDGRTSGELRDTIGPLERFLPISVPVNGGLRFAQLCAALAVELDRANEWQDSFSWSSFADLEDEEVRIRSFDYCFEFVGAARKIAATPGLTLTRRFSRSEPYRLKLDFACADRGDGWVALHYDPLHFSPYHARELLNTYCGALEQVEHNREIRLRELQWSNTRARDAEPHMQASSAGEIGCVGERFQQIAARYPDRVALADDQRCLSYACLAAKTASLAGLIRDRSPEPESCVAVVGAISFNTLVGLLAVLQAGRYFLHIDPDYPPVRALRMLRECGTRLILRDGTATNTSTAAVSDALGISTDRVIDVDIDALAEGQPVVAGVHPAQLAYVIYTSGSTGDPNGVMISQGSLARQISWLTDTFGFSDQDSWLLKTPLGFDASVWEWVTPLCVGGKLVLGGTRLHLEPARVGTCIADHRVTVLQVVPNLLRTVLSEAQRADLGSLRLLFAGGEELPADLCSVLKKHSRLEVVNLYGPTETTINATSWTVPSGFGATTPTRIGRPVAGMGALVLDRLGQELPPGFIGELHLLGSGLARGYAGKPEVTAGKFVPSPIGVGRRMYRTGDRVCRGQDGDLRFLGRLDEQIKLRGYRIELGELEGTLSAHPRVKTAAACIWDATGVAGGERLIAYAVAKDAAARPVAEELRAYLRSQLPEYMVPASIIVLDSLPLTSTGKVNRKTLASPEFIELHRAGTHVAPETRTQRILADIWRQILQVEVIGINDDFLKLGGQSLLVTRLVAHVRRALGVELSPRVVFDFPVLRQLAEHIDRGVT